MPDHARRKQAIGAIQGSPMRRAAFRAAAAVLTVAAPTIVAVALVQGFKIGHTETIFLAAVLIVAVAFGMTYGLLAAIAAFIAYRLLLGMPLTPPDPGAQDTLQLTLFALGVALTGLYTDTVRKRNRQARSLLEAGRPLSAHASDRAVGHFFSLTKQEGPKVGYGSALDEALRAGVSVCIVGAGLAAAWIVKTPFGPSAGVVTALTSVLVVAGLLGARLGLAAGVLAILVLSAVLKTAMTPMATGFDLAAFAAAGWGVGVLADRLRHERAALETLVAAGRDLSSSTDEGAIRRVLFDSLSKVAAGGVILLTNDSGALVAATPGAEAALEAAQTRPEVQTRWRSRRLAADDRDAGVVRWRFGGSAKDAGVADDIAVSLIDLGASAIVRTRLGLEKADMEFVARTEHLRTILLDAVSHHFRSPLAGILGSVTSILSLPDQHDRGMRRDLLLIIKEQANRLNRYVSNFLSVARLESGSIDVNLADLSIEPLIYDVWESFGEAGGARRFLHVKIDPDLVRADASLLVQVFGNVLENAIKYSAEGSVVDVRSRKTAAMMIIEVCDRGPGIPAASEARIFERFYRSQGATAPGLGLGLYITRSLVEMLGGRVEARNRPDGESGLIVSIALPLTETPA